MGWGSLVGKTSVPVLCYHNLGGNGVPRQSFASQMHWLKDNGITTLNQNELRNFLAGKALNNPSVMITFDDGFRDLYTFAGPLLKNLGFTATVFVINNRIRPDDAPGTTNEIIAHRAHLEFLKHQKRSPWLSVSELKELLEEGAFELGSHSSSHLMGPAFAPELVELPEHWAYALQEGQKGPYSKLEPELAQPLWLEQEKRLETTQELTARVQKNLENSRHDLEKQFKIPVRAFAWPWGESCPAAEQAAEDAGLDMRFTLRRSAVTQGTPVGAIPRLEIRRHKGLSWFASRIALYSRSWTASLYSGARI